MSKYSRVLKALSTPRKVKVLMLLAKYHETGVTVTELYTEAEMEQSVCSQILMELRAVGLVDKIKNGTKHIYKLTTLKTISVIKSVEDLAGQL